MWVANAFLRIRSLWRPSRLLRRGQLYSSWKAISLLFESISGSKRGNFPSKQERVPHTLHRISKITETTSNRQRVGLLDAAMEKAFTIIADLKAKSCAPCREEDSPNGEYQAYWSGGMHLGLHTCLTPCALHVTITAEYPGETEVQPRRGLIYVGIWISTPRRKSLGHLGQHHLDFWVCIKD